MRATPRDVWQQRRKTRKRERRTLRARRRQTTTRQRANIAIGAHPDAIDSWEWEERKQGESR